MPLMAPYIHSYLYNFVRESAMFDSRVRAGDTKLTEEAS